MIKLWNTLNKKYDNLPALTRFAMFIIPYTILCILLLENHGMLWLLIVGILIAFRLGYLRDWFNEK